MSAALSYRVAVWCWWLVSGLCVGLGGSLAVYWLIRAVAWSLL